MDEAIGRGMMLLVEAGGTFFWLEDRYEARHPNEHFLLYYGCWTTRMAGDLPSPSSALPHSLLDDLNCEDDVEPAPGLPRPPVADKHLSSEFLQNLSTYDEWEWKTSAKDFKPSTDAGGAFSSSGSTFGGSHSHSGFSRSPLLGPSTGSSSTESPSLDPRSQSWTARASVCGEAWRAEQSWYGVHWQWELY
eukprot:Skav232708  [mRNA]  locus=scaffold3459:98096:106618:- [translate_table: standard]